LLSILRRGAARKKIKGAGAPFLILWVAGDAVEVAIKERCGDGNKEARENAAKIGSDAAGFCAGVCGVGHFGFSWLAASLP
jgi:hypothetical protein